MKTVSVKISFQNDLLAEIDAEAKREACSRSELLWKAARLYIQRKLRWEQAFQLGDAIAERWEIGKADVAEEIAAYRQEKQSRP